MKKAKYVVVVLRAKGTKIIVNTVPRSDFKPVVEVVKL